MFIELTRIIKDSPEKKIVINTESIEQIIPVCPKQYHGANTMIISNSNTHLSFKESYDEVKNIIVSVLEVKYNNDNIII